MPQSSLLQCLEAVEWRGNVAEAGNPPLCPQCRGAYPNHLVGCFLNATLKKARKSTEKPMPDHSPLPWYESPAGSIMSGGVVVTGPPHGDGNTAFIIRAVNCHEQLVSTLESIQWRGNVTAAGQTVCPACNGEYPHHTDDCYLAAILAKAKGDEFWPPVDIPSTPPPVLTFPDDAKGEA